MIDDPGGRAISVVLAGNTQDQVAECGARREWSRSSLAVASLTTKLLSFAVPVPALFSRHEPSEFLVFSQGGHQLKS